MTLYARQKLLLALVQGAGGAVSATDFQKLLFLYTRKWEHEPSFQFVPYRFGGVSFQSYADRKTLIDKGLLFPLEKGEWEADTQGLSLHPQGTRGPDATLQHQGGDGTGRCPDRPGLP